MIKKSAQKSLYKTMVISVLLSALVILAAAFILSYLMLEDKISLSVARKLTIISLVLAAFIGGLLVILKTKKRKIAYSILNAVLLITTFMTLDLLLLGGMSTQLWGRGLWVMLGGVCAAVICLIKRTPKARMKMRSR